MYDQRCCKLRNPMGVDINHIDFCWKSDEAVRKIRIYVSSGLEKCLVGEGDLWDTGWKEHQYRVFWPYKGALLKSHHLYYWNVETIYEKDGYECFEKGTPQVFLTGISQSEWKGKWIAGQNEAVYNKELLFMKDIHHHNLEDRIFVYIATYGYHCLYVNGQKAGCRELAPSRSNYTGYKKAQSVAYDITDYLKKNKNVIGVLTDAGWTRVEKEVKPTINVQIYGQSGELEVHTDSTWNVMNTGNIMRDRYVEGDGVNPFGWSDFGNEEISNLNPIESYEIQTGAEPEILDIHPIIESEKTEKDVVLDIIKPVSVTRNEAVKIDMGKNFTGFLCALVLVGGDREILVKASDKKEENMSFNQVTKYILSEGKHELKGHFQYVSGRYFEISGLKKNDKIENIRGLLVGNHLMRTGYFKCSDSTLNQIFEVDLHTFLCNTVGGLTMDCPHRERLGYGETGINTLIGCGLPYFESAAFYSNYFTMWVDCQEESGCFPHVVPNYHGGGGTAWSSFPVIGFYEYWEIYHDVDLLQQLYPSLKKWCDYLTKKCKNGLLHRYEFGEWDFLGDWAAPDGRNDWGDSEEALFFNNLYFTLVLNIMIKLAQYMKEKDDVKVWESQLKSLRGHINAKYFHPQEAYYHRQEAKYQALAILSEIVPENHKESVYQQMLCIVQEKGYLDGGSVGNTILLKALSLSEEGNRLVYQWLHRNQIPSYKYFLDQGETTWPEMWDIQNIYGGSRIHTCYTGIAGWFLYGLMGVRVFWKQGEFQYEIKPYCPEELEWAELQYETPFGKIEYRWEKDTIKFKE